MRLLVLGGTAWLSSEVARQAVAAGHDVACACRGNGALPDGARHVRWDRSSEPAPVDDVGPVDAVVDVARHPSYVRAAVAGWPEAHWVFVSTVNVYAEDETPGGPGDTPLHEAVTTDEDLATNPEAYGPMKVACENLVREGAASAAITRPGLIVGPGDPTGRFTYWPERLAEGGEILAGGDPQDRVQVIDVRDYATWILHLAEQRIAGDFDVVRPPEPIGDLLTAMAPDARLTWVPGDFLTEHGVEPWAGPDGLPLWLPRPDYDGMMGRDPSASLAAGLTCRPIAATGADVVAWLAATPDAVRTGLSREAERRVLDAWALENQG